MNFVDFTKLKDLQEGKSERSGLLLRKVLGALRLESAFAGDTDRPDKPRLHSIRWP